MKFKPPALLLFRPVNAQIGARGQEGHTDR